MIQKGKYIYCILKEKKPGKLDLKGMDGEAVCSITEGDLSAIISDSDAKEYLISRENIMIHQKVLEEVFKKYDILPVSFGTVAASENELREKILKAKSKEIESELKKIKGKAEFGLKAFWLDMGSVFQEIGKNSGFIQDLKKQKNIGYQDKISAGEIIAKLINQKKEAEKEKMLKFLKEMSDDFKSNAVLGDAMIFNAVFLVEKKNEKKFDKAVNELGEKYGQKVKFIYSGPFSPFNFVKLAF